MNWLNALMILVSVIEEVNVAKGVSRKASFNRVKFYFERGRLTSGKGERIGFVVNEPKNKYNDLFVRNQLVSVVGKDILSDQAMPYDGLFSSEAVLLQRSNFVTHDPYDLSNEDGVKAADLEEFYPEYVEELGLITYLPKFDKKLNL